MSAAQAIRLTAPDDEIVVVSDDPQPYYFRASLTNYLMGDLTVEELDALPRSAWKTLGIRHLAGRAARLDPVAHRLEVEGQGDVTYDRLLVATGARARRLSTPERDPRRGVPGADLDGVVVMRTYADAQAIVAACPTLRRVAVVGGGILGLEAANGFFNRGVAVTLLHDKPVLFERSLDRTASDLVLNRMRRAGRPGAGDVDVRLSCGIAEIVGDRKRRVRSVVLTDGDRIDVDLVLAAIGNVPNTEWLAGSGIEVAQNGSLPVDLEMRVRGATDVYAAGDLVDFVDPDSPWRNPGGLWAPARKQGRVAGRNMVLSAAEEPVEYRPGVLYNATRVWDLDVGTLGYHVDDPKADDAVPHVFDPAVPVYKRATLRGGRLHGVLLLGDRREGQAMRRLMNLQGAAADVSDVVGELFRPEFDLFAFVARQESSSVSPVWRRTVHIARGPIPPSVVRRGATVQRVLATGPKGATPLVEAPTGEISIVSGPSTRKFGGTVVRIGPQSNSDIRVEAIGQDAEALVLSREGMNWRAVSTAGRSARAKVNGIALRGTHVLCDRDRLELHAWRGTVRFSEHVRPVADSARVVAELMGSRRYPLHSKTTVTLGSSRESEILLAVPGVEPDHAQIEVGADGTACWLKPLAGDTFVGDQRIEVPRRLKAGDVVRLGPVVPAASADGGAASRPSATLRFQPHEAPTPRARPIEGPCVYLIAVEGPLVGRTLAVPLGATIGRGPEADVRLADPLVSSAHARFDAPLTAPTVTDLGSSNGVFLDGQRIESGRAVAIHEGATLQVGRTRFRLSMREDVAALVTKEDPPTPRSPRAGLEATVVLRDSGHRLIEQLPDGRPLVRLIADGERVVHIGRGPACEIVLMPNDVSASHARLTAQGRGYVIEDLGSKFGTRVNHQPVVPGRQVPLHDGDRIEIASVVFVYREGTSAGAAGRTSAPDARLSRRGAGAAASVDLVGNGPFILGRKPSERDRDQLPGEDVIIEADNLAVSRVQVEIVRTAHGHRIRSLSSTSETTVDGVALGSESVAIGDGSLVVFDEATYRFEVVTRIVPVSKEPPREAAPPPLPRPRAKGFAVDGAADTGDTRRLDVIVFDEVDACIGCHDCMRACPLEQSTSVGIGSLNAFVDGLGDPSARSLEFIRACTQCQACVPACPADLHRSRMVLFNKLKPSALPPADEPIVFQIGSAQVKSDWTRADGERRVAHHPILATLTGEQRRRLLGPARWRRLAPGERLFVEGAYVDALWLIVEGNLDVFATMAKGRLQSMTTLGPGQTAGEGAVLADQPAEFGVRAVDECTLVGLPKHALDAMRREKHVRPADPAQLPFPELLESLYVGSTAEAALVRFLRLAPDNPKDQRTLERLLGVFDAGRFAPGETILEAKDVSKTFVLVRRGFAREVRFDSGPRVLPASRDGRGVSGKPEPREITANLLKAGDSFGGRDSRRRGELVRFEASTLCEALIATTADLRALDAHEPGLFDRLVAIVPFMDDAPDRERARRLDEAVKSGAAQGAEVLVIDTRLCVDCDNCVSACERRHGHARLDRTGRAQQVGPFQIPASCFHCDDPKCLLCAVEGIVRDPGGEIRIIEDRCIGCGACAERCPYDNIEMVRREPAGRSLVDRLIPDAVLRLFGWIHEEGRVPDNERVAVKCDLCIGYKDGPACVRACPVGAAARVDALALFSGGAEAVR